MVPFPFWLQMYMSDTKTNTGTNNIKADLQIWHWIFKCLLIFPLREREYTFINGQIFELKFLKNCVTDITSASKLENRKQSEGYRVRLMTGGSPVHIPQMICEIWIREANMCCSPQPPSQQTVGPWTWHLTSNYSTEAAGCLAMNHCSSVERQPGVKMLVFLLIEGCIYEYLQYFWAISHFIFLYMR